MSVSYQFSQQHNFQTVLWAIGGAIYQAAVTTGNAYRAVRSWLPGLLYALAILAKDLGLTLALVAVVAVVAMLPVQLWVGLAIVGAYGWVTYPRKAVRK